MRTEKCRTCGETYDVEPTGLDWLDELPSSTCPECRRESLLVYLSADPATTPHGGAWRVTRGRLTTRHSASSYGHPVIVIDGEPYGPADILGVADTVAQVEGAASEAYRRAIAAGYPAVEPVAQLRKDGRL